MKSHRQYSNGRSLNVERGWGGGAPVISKLTRDLRPNRGRQGYGGLNAEGRYEEERKIKTKVKEI